MFQIRDLRKKYSAAATPAVDNVSLDIQAGDFLSLLGRSGSGKSTLLNMLSLLVQPDSGQIVFEGKDLCRCHEKERTHLRRELFAVVFQQHHLMPYMTALENVLLPYMGGVSFVTAGQRGKACEMLFRVGLEGKESSLPRNLSGGEQQRVALARALVRGAKVLFADEPTGSLDSATGGAIMALLQEFNKDGVTVVMVTHNPEYARQSGRTITMADGKIETIS